MPDGPPPVGRTSRMSHPQLSDDALVSAALRSIGELSILIFDRDMRIVAVHGGAVARHGYDPDALVGRRVPDVLPAPAWARLGPQYLQALSGETATVDATAQDGTAVYRTTFEPVRDRGRVIGGMATSRDITAELAARDDALRAREDLESVLASSLEGHCRLRPDGTLLWASPAMEEITGFPVDELVGLQVAAVIHPDDLERRDRALADTLATGRPHTIELRARHADGSWRWIESDVRVALDEEGAPREVHTTSRDVSERRAGEELRRQWQVSFDTTSRGILFVDPDTDRIARVNPTFARMLGGAPDDFAGMPMARLAAGGGEQVRTVAATVGETGAYHGETAFRRLDGSTFPAEVEVVATRDADERLLYRLGFVTDLTERRAREASERAAVARFEAAFSSAPTGMALVAPDGRLLKVNEALCRLLGREERELLASGFQELTHPEDLDADLALVAETLDGRREGYEMHKRYLRPGGEVVHARLAVRLVRDGAGAPEYFISQIVDLTSLERARRELSEAKGRLQAVLDHSPTAISMRDLQRRWIVANPATCALVGRSEEELLARPLEATPVSPLLHRLAAHDAEVLAAGRALDFDEAVDDPWTGRKRHLWGLGFPVRDGEGCAVGVGGMLVDVTEREQTQRALVAAQALFETAFAAAPVGMLILRLDDDGTAEVLECNEAFAQMVGRLPEQIVGQDPASLVHPDDTPERDRLVRAALAGRPAGGEVRLSHRDGRDVWALVVPATTHDVEGRRLVVLQAVDISERKRFERQLRHVAEHDALTGLQSRRRFEDELRREAARLRRHGGHACLLLMDLDGFKEVNDAFGHSAGDQLLVQIAAALTRSLRAEDVIGRLGGDEFAVLLPGADATAGQLVAGKLTDVVRQAGRVVREDGVAEVTASIGVTTFDGPGLEDVERLLVEADIAMYDAKDAGRDGVVLYDRRSGGRDRLVRRADWVGRLRRALRDGGLALEAQPIVPLARGASPEERFELLLRLQADDGTLVTPGAFLPHAERHGLVVELDRWVLGQAVGLLHDAARGGRDLRLSVNLSARSVHDPVTVSHLAALLHERPVPAGRLTVELTETAAIPDLRRAAELSRRLRELGCHVALDDFGAGFASFAYLKHLVFDTLKIDGDFIDRLASSATDQLVVRAIVGIARAMGATLVAERVGDDASVAILRDLGVEFGQGFHLGRPGPLPPGP
jgi:diguanylate cyclase (GGDEF)-like protein/PAS domain S-box-containing protein